MLVMITGSPSHAYALIPVLCFCTGQHMHVTAYSNISHHLLIFYSGFFAPAGTWKDSWCEIHVCFRGSSMFENCVYTLAKWKLAPGLYVSRSNRRSTASYVCAAQPTGRGRRAMAQASWSSVWAIQREEPPVHRRIPWQACCTHRLAACTL